MPAVPRSFPHVASVEDRHSQASLRLLWERIYGLESSLTDADAARSVMAEEIEALQAANIVLERKVARLAVSPTAGALLSNPDLRLEIIDSGAVSGPFPEGPTPATFPGLGTVQIYSSPDVSGWTETGTITRFGFQPGLWLVDYSTRPTWLPGVNIGGALQEATIWLFFQIGGTWYGAGAERLRPNQTSKVESTNYSQWPGDFWYTTRWGPLNSGFVPGAGQPAAALITAGSTRVDNKTDFTERTNLITFGWPADGTAVEIV